MADFDIKDIVKLLKLSSEKKDLVLSIYSIVVETCSGLVSFLPQSSRGNCNYELRSKQEESSDQIQASRRNLVYLIDLLESYESKCEKFKKNFLAWEITRKKNVECLNEIAKSIYKDHKFCNIVGISSNSVAALGGILLFSALFISPAAPVLVPLLTSGMVAAGTGGVASFATTVADVSFLNKHLGNTKKICEEDKLNFELLGDWISHTEELEKTLTDFIGWDIWTEMEKNFKDFIEERRKLSALIPPGFVAIIKNCVNKACTGNPLLINLGIDATAAILTTLIAMILFQRRTLPVHKLGLEAVRGVGTLVKIVKLARAARQLKSTQTLGKRVALKAFAGVGEAIDLTMIVLSSMELAKGEMSEEGKNILEVSEMLEEERKVLRDVYESMACTNY